MTTDPRPHVQAVVDAQRGQHRLGQRHDQPAEDRIVEPGEIGVAIGGASDRLPLRGSFVLTGPERAVGAERVLDTPAEISAG
jgi:hypothetical protein